STPRLGADAGPRPPPSRIPAAPARDCAPPALAEEALQQFARLITQHASIKLRAVIQAGILYQIEQCSTSPGLGVTCAVHHALHAPVDDRARAHGAGLERDIQRALVQPPLSARL